MGGIIENWCYLEGTKEARMGVKNKPKRNKDG